MTREYVWTLAPNGNVWWLRSSHVSTPVGLIHREDTDDDTSEWRVATWRPKEVILAHLPGEMTDDEALGTARTLILLRLKE